MRVIVGADDDSEAYEAALTHLKSQGVTLQVVEKQSWPDVALAVATQVANGTFDMGVLMCWTGTGTSMVANKVPGARAALCWDPWIAEGARRWNDANILVMSLKRTEPSQVIEILDAWLAVEEPDADEQVNIAKIAAYEERD
ncbi:MAG TPA: RpiB/LacA/LacB family sugar-phosphate isomerase [Actinomycetota bacterium]|nr:RpiB/LacA/LacB family sugar-phosphate isomerase [Actinomycetota bacterium]